MQIVPTPNPTIDGYYAALANYAGLGVTHEQGVRSAFRSLLDTFAKPAGWTLIEEHTLPGSRKRPDGTLLDDFRADAPDSLLTPHGDALLPTSLNVLKNRRRGKTGSQATVRELVFHAHSSACRSLRLPHQ